MGPEAEVPSAEASEEDSLSEALLSEEALLVEELLSEAELSAAEELLLLLHSLQIRLLLKGMLHRLLHMQTDLLQLHHP